MRLDFGPSRWLDRLGVRRVSPQASVDWEIEHHLAELADRLMEVGWSQTDALAEAERRFGDRRRYEPIMMRMERVGAARGRAMDGLRFLRQSVTGALRTARRYPGFASGVILTLGLGIGANATMYGIVDRLLLRPPEHIEHPDRVRRVVVERPNRVTGERTRQTSLSFPDYEDLLAHDGLEVAAYDQQREFTLGSGASATKVNAVLASASLFPVLGVEPLFGRLFTEAEAEIGAPLTALISEEYWRRTYHHDAEVLGRTIEIDERTATIIGVLPAGFTGVDLSPVDLWLPIGAACRDSSQCMTGQRNWYWMNAVARLHDDVSREQAEAQATSLHRNGRRADIDAGRYSDEATVVLPPLIAAAGPDPSAESRVARWLMGVAVIVLLIACANVTNILLARGAKRKRETAVRLALGVGRARLIGQMMVEAVALALAGGAFALGTARWGGAFIRRMLLPDVYFPDSAMNGRVILFTGAVALLAGFVAGVLPAIQSSRSSVRSHFAGGWGETGARSRFRGALTVAQAGMAVILLVGAGLFVRSLTALRSQDLGLDVERLLLVDFEFVDDDPSTSTKSEVYGQAGRRIAALPAVAGVAGTMSPITYSLSIRLRVQDLDSLPALPGGGPYMFSVDASYFETAGLSILQGRAFNDGDTDDAPKVAVVDETMARAIWPDESPLGKCLIVGSETEECTTVVGVVEAAARNGYRDEAFMAYYLSMPQGPGDFTRAPNGLYVRARRDAEDAKASVSAALRSFSPEVRWTRVESLREILDPQARSWTLGATMFTVFGVLALVLAAIGLYAVLAFDVAQRTRELGVRTALGARRGELLRAVLYRGIGMGGMGIALGLTVAYLAAPYAEDLLFEVSPRDPWILGGVAVALLAVGAAAAVVPGLRATRVDPISALKSD